jgi:amidohydrolase
VEASSPAARAGADPARAAELLAEARSLQPELIRWRRHLHAHPEPSGQEFETAAFLARELEALGVKPQMPVPNAVIAEVGPAGAGPVVALRADIDALPIAEETGLPFASTRPGLMHACGHDGHAACLLGVAHLLVRRSRRPGGGLPGRVRLLFQPCEEVPPGGARTMIALGALDGVAAIAGLHLWSPLRTGTAVVASGPAWAAADRFRAVVRGRGGHGAQPHLAVDAVEVACRAVCALQSIVSRRVDPLEPAVVSVGTLHAGQAFNIIAETATLEGTVRAFAEEVRALLRREVERVLRCTAAASGADLEFEYVEGYPPLVNDPDVAEVVRSAAEAVLGPGTVRPGPREMVADDFAFYARLVPGCYLTLGAGGPAGPGPYPHHHPRFDIDEAALPAGAAILAETALGLLQALRP